MIQSGYFLNLRSVINKPSLKLSPVVVYSDPANAFTVVEASKAILFTSSTAAKFYFELPVDGELTSESLPLLLLQALWKGKRVFAYNFMLKGMFAKPHLRFYLVELEAGVELLVVAFSVLSDSNSFGTCTLIGHCY